MTFTIERARQGAVKDPPCAGAYVDGRHRYWWGKWDRRWVIDIPDLAALLALSAAEDHDLIIGAAGELGTPDEEGRAVDGHIVIYDGYVE